MVSDIHATRLAASLATVTALAVDRALLARACRLCVEFEGSDSRSKTALGLILMASLNYQERSDL